MIDDISMEIIRILQEKARIPNVEVARQVGMAPSAVLERIRKLEKMGIIDGYEVRLNPEHFGRSMVVFVVVKVRDPEGDPDIGERLSAIAEAQEVHYISSEDGYLVKLRLSDTSELARLLRRKIRNLPGVVSTRTAIALETHKETLQIALKNGSSFSDSASHDP